MRKILTACFWLIVVAYPLALLRADDPAEALPLLTVSANRFGPTFELVTLDIAGQNAKLELPHRGEAHDPFWSPDGRKLVYRSGKFGPLQACLFDVDRGEEINLTKSAVNEHQPVWSPDGKRIAFASSRAPAARLYLMDADGSNVRDLLGRNLEGYIGPSWSPDGEQILYSGPDGTGALQIFVVNADGKAAEALTDGPGFNGYAVYSPDGRYIAYVHFDRPFAQAPEGGKLMLYDTETLTHTPITPDGMRCGMSKVVWKPQRGKAGGQDDTRK